MGVEGAEATVMSQGQVGSRQGQGDTCRSTAAGGNLSWIPRLGRMFSQRSETRSTYLGFVPLGDRKHFVMKLKEFTISDNGRQLLYCDHGLLS